MGLHDAVPHLPFASGENVWTSPQLVSPGTSANKNTCVCTVPPLFQIENFSDCLNSADVVLSQKWDASSNAGGFTLNSFGLPNSCSSQAWPYNEVVRAIKSDKGLAADMKRYVSSQELFWVQKWKDQGSCFFNSNCITDCGQAVPKYFKLALDVFYQFDVKEMLEKKNITPRKELYPKNEIKSALGPSASLVCNGKILSEVNFQLSATKGYEFEPRKALSSLDSCPDRISYPVKTNVFKMKRIKSNVKPDKKIISKPQKTNTHAHSGEDF